MNPDTILASVQKGFRTTLGAASFVVDLVQYPDQRDTNLNRLQTDLEQLTEEWAVKGEQTEQEARSFVEHLVNSSTGATAGTSSTTSARNPGPSAPPDIQTDLEDLTNQIAAIRKDLETLREQENS
jgi:polyhydroxyalkanoate synthesis regulator phasin